MRRVSILLLVAVMLLPGCGKQTAAADVEQTPSWQEQYDLGIRYLSEGNYEEAIIAFTAAIEIDPKRAEAYVGRGDAYVLSGETEDNLTAAQADYEKAIDLDEANVEAYLGLADVYIRRGEYDKAINVLRNALEKTENDQAIAEKIAEMEGGVFEDSSGKARRSNHYENNELVEYWLYEYDQMGNNIRTTCYDASNVMKNVKESEFDENGNEIRRVTTYTDSKLRTVESFAYDTAGRRVRIDSKDLFDGSEQNVSYTLITYDDVARTETRTDYQSDGTVQGKFVIEYDADGVRHRADHYETDDSGELYLDYYVEYIWNEDGSYGGYNLFQVAQ
ncbi:MAG: tetratricopeptide repeat protein [Lawsonibacter sp.]|jgi:tetratricopeptide (TPR) repeat protein|nr:tetratricopeptide repeat protein [Lawsonibacter sp.]